MHLIKTPARPRTSISYHDNNGSSRCHSGRSLVSSVELDRLNTAATIYRPLSQSIIKYDVLNTPVENEWRMLNEKHCKRSISERNSARKLADEVIDIVKVIDHETKQRQLISTHSLGARISSLSYWKEKLNKEIVLMRNIMYELSVSGLTVKSFATSQMNLERHLESITCPLIISLKCLDERQKRIGIDAIRDKVENNLYKEIDTLKKCQRRLKDLSTKAEEQLKTSTTALEALERDVRNKTHAQKLDSEMYQLHNKVEKLNSSELIDNMTTAFSHPLSWAKHSYDNMQRSQKEREGCMKLCNRIKEQIKWCENEMWNHSNSVNVALKVRVQTLLIVRNNLQSHLQQVNTRIQEQEKVAEKIKEAIVDKEVPLQIAQTRLQERNKRIEMELCRDIVVELVAIREEVVMLKSKLQAVTRSIERLHKVQVKLEEEIRVKDTSLDIDGRICLSLRKNIQQDNCKLTYVPVLTVM
ncbi:hypothetical protein HELRODRAFT_176749 [Helobdella robusta]|uniref:Tektin n=1 Tax=Helobdella robusta TaxID=6412 RepID=T1FAV5_HELRO|nr:hypothetical protein HELRODRAFT_176749 [Helobdella robusta]ESN99582.1 hypothetical protein HELRODRAFT_176749 [Helobdella robusta]